jgi:hypothetical protein
MRFRRSMRRVSVVVFLGFWALTIGWLTVHDSEDVTARAQPRVDAGAEASAPTPALPVELDAGVGGGAALGDDPPLVDLLPDEDAVGEDGGALPSLAEAPKSVVFGVVLVQYGGAQGAAAGARSKADATELATQIAELAKTDFAAAVAKGDPGSSENAGRMFRTILEPELEVALFTLEKGAVSAPVDTPRGFWVLKRLE